MELPSAHLSPSSKNKKIYFEKNSYIFSKKAFLIFQKSTQKKFLYFLMFQEMELSVSNIKHFLVFFQEKDFPIFWEMESLEKFLILQETET